MSDKIFVDTNLWLYLYAPSSDETKTETIKILVDKYFENIVITSNFEPRTCNLEHRTLRKRTLISIVM